MSTYVNGNRVSVVDSRLTLDGERIAKGVLQSLDWTSTLEPGIIKDGNSIRSAGRTAGKYEANVSFELLLEDAEQFEFDLTGDGATGLLQTEFDMEHQFKLEDSQTTFVQTVAARGLRLKSHGYQTGGGSDPIKMKYECTLIAPIEVNGRPDIIEDLS